MGNQMNKCAKKCRRYVGSAIWRHSLKKIREKLPGEKLQGVAATPLGCIRVNANQSKCLFSSCKRRSKQNILPKPQFEINGRTIEYVNEWPHLGHIISVILMTRPILCNAAILWQDR